jgi:hypothetical protein
MQNLRMPLNVVFVGEDGIDRGGLSAEMYRSFFKECLETEMFVDRES